MSSKTDNIIVATSGYSFDDWEGPFYPPGTPKGKRLDYYKDHFRATEINSTYYRIPHPAVFYNMIKKVDKNFEFMVKTHRSFTHDRKELSEQSKLFLESIKPISESGQLKGLLAQFPFAFKFSKGNLDYILNGKDYFPSMPLFVEFRHVSWHKPEVYQALRDNGIGFCCVDSPSLPGLFPRVVEATTRTGYIRLHGRNAANWWGSEGDRYDYDYSEPELKEWVAKVNHLKSQTDRLYLFFNNCHLGQAVRNAKIFINMLQLASM